MVRWLSRISRGWLMVKLTDFNDLAQEVGSEAVKTIIEQALAADAAPVKVIAPKQGEASANGNEDEPRQWPEAVLFDAGPDLPDLNADILPAPMGAYCKALATELQVPEGLPVIITLAVLGVALQRRFVVKPFAESDYTEPLSFWGAVLLGSGNRKSAAVERLAQPLKLWERRASKVLRQSLDQAETERAVSEKRIAKLRNDAAGCDDDEARKARIAEIGTLQAAMPPELFPPRLWTGDVTPERLEAMLVEQRGRMAVLSDEAAIFAVMSGLYSDGLAKLDVFLQAHSAQAIRVDRASREAHIERPALSFGLAIQPGMLEDLPDAQRRRFRHSGLLARFAWVLPKSRVGWRETRRVSPVPLSLRMAYEDAMANLLPDPSRWLAEALGDTEDAPEEWTLTGDALDLWQEFREQIEPMMRPGGELEPVMDWAGKLPGLVLRVAGLLHPLMRGLDCDEIGADTMSRALAIGWALIPHARAVFEGLGADAAQSDARRIFPVLLAKVKAGETEIAKTEIVRALHSHLSGARLDRALQALQERQILGQAFDQKTAGRPRAVLPINPGIAK